MMSMFLMGHYLKLVVLEGMFRFLGCMSSVGLGSQAKQSEPKTILAHIPNNMSRLFALLLCFN